MRLVTFKAKGEETSLGFLENSIVYDVRKTYNYLFDKQKWEGSLEMFEVLNLAGDTFRLINKAYKQLKKISGRTQEMIGKKISYRVADIKILLPFTPSAIICSGNNYADHLQEKEVLDSKDLKGEDIELFLKLPQTLIGPYDPIPYSKKLTEKLDYENELAVVVGREAWQLSPAEAKKCIFGYSIINDLSARDRQMTPTKGVKVGLSKNFEGCGALGPCIATVDEFKEPLAMEILTQVNGETRQHSNTRLMIHDPAFLISYFSQYFKLKPGYLLATGTVGGTAWSTDPVLGGVPYERPDIVRGGYLKPGDVVVCSIEGIGELRNTVHK